MGTQAHRHTNTSLAQRRQIKFADRTNRSIGSRKHTCRWCV